jgi:hypothetical protein
MQMKPSSLYLALALFCLTAWGSAQARDLVVPAGTLMTCTLDEPKFSSATVSVGDPFLCYPRTMQSFGQTVFPRGTYLVGHLEADKEPGHFVGKGYLKLSFDRIGLPSSDLPLNAKIIAVAGYNVDRQGKIIGHGHATRDTVEWMLPPLWPWKILTLPARGPRPTLKGEVRITLRVMDDIVIPQNAPPGWHRFGEQPSAYPGTGSLAVPPRTITATNNQTLPVTVPVDDAAISQQPLSLAAAAAAANPARVTYALTAPAVTCQSGMAQQVVIAPTVQPQLPASVVVRRAPVEAPSTANAWPSNVTLFALADGTVFPVTQYWLDRDTIVYISDGDKGRVGLSSIDWSSTTKLNTARNVRVILRNAPATSDPGAN